ncbi:hypothetical protein AAVH_09088 [Aphelenchoides avenae]|nr:hypothetical protein AAVH_09088 [Aphelenchus avenae]
MKSNNEPKQNREAGGKSDGKNVVPGNDGFASGGTGNPPNPEASSGVVPPGSSYSTGGTPMEVDSNASGKDKVTYWSKEVEKLCYAYGDQLMQVTQEKIDKLKLVDPQLVKDTVGSSGPIRKKVQPALNQCLAKLVDAVPEESELSLDLEGAHPAVRALEGFQKQVDHLKESEADLYQQCTELQEKLSRAQKDVLASNDEVGILDAVKALLGTDDVNVVGNLVAKKKHHESLMDTIRNLEVKIADLESHDLERQLRAAQHANVNLQKLVADQQKKTPSGSGGAQQSLIERARDIGFVVDTSGNLQLGPPRQVFETSKPYCYTSRNQAVPAPPPLKVFLGEYKEDKMGLSEFLKMYKHRITFDELESRMRNLMLDNSRTGMLLKQQRVHTLRMKEDESYLSFITFLETKVCEAYDEGSYSIVDGVKIQVNIINKVHLQDILRKSPERLRKAKCLTVHPPGVSIKDASGERDRSCRVAKVLGARGSYELRCRVGYNGDSWSFPVV